MKKNILIFFSIILSFNSKVFADEFFFINPGIQFGIDSNGNKFRSVQVNLGHYDGNDLPFGAFVPALTIGVKKIKIENEWKKYRYYDVQVTHLENIILPGFGFGFIQGNDLQFRPRVKLWAGWFILANYELEYIEGNIASSKGLFGVLPIPLDF